jgi:tetratricopeptide (TPR) repeat protein
VKKFFRNWLKTTPQTLLAVMVFLMFGLVGTYSANGQSWTQICLIAAVVIFGYSVFAALWDNPDRLNPGDRHIIKDTFSGGGRRSRRFHRTLRMIAEGNFADALDELNNLREQISSGRERAVLCFYTGRCYQYMGYPTNATKQFREAIETGIDVDEVYTICGREMVSCGDFSGAESIYNELLARKASSDYILTDMGMLYIKSGDPDKALRVFSESIKQHMNYAFAMGGCALAYLLKKDTDNAKFFYGQAIVNNIDDIEGFTEYYINVAETQGLTEDIGIKQKPKLYFDPSHFETR